MKLVSIFLLLLSFSGLAETKELLKFNALVVTGRFNLELIESDDFYAEVNINGKDFDESKLKFIYSGDELEVKYVGGFIRLLPVTIKVYCKNINSLTANQGAIVKVNKAFNFYASKIDFTVFAGGKLDVNVNSNWIVADVKQGGSLNISGETTLLNANVITGGIITANLLKANKVEATVKFGGEIICNAKEILIATVTSGGSIHYTGNPEVEQTIKLGGKIEKL